MEKISRQQRRKITRDLGRNKWIVKDWQPMKFDRQQKDMAGLAENINIYTNNIYQCIVREHDDYTHLSIRRRDKTPTHNWQHMQQIKNDICGKEREGVELYPAMSRIVDTNNLYHLWVFRGYVDGIGFNTKSVKM